MDGTLLKFWICQQNSAEIQAVYNQLQICQCCLAWMSTSPDWPYRIVDLYLSRLCIYRFPWSFRLDLKTTYSLSGCDLGRFFLFMHVCANDCYCPQGLIFNMQCCVTSSDFSCFAFLGSLQTYRSSGLVYLLSLLGDQASACKFVGTCLF